MKESRIVFLQIPENLREQLAGGTHDAFTINTGIPVPVEITEDCEKTNLENLSMEMILSGMLRVIEAGQERQEWIDYYRDFVLVLRPDILAEFTEAAIIKARNEDFDSALEILSVLEGLFPSSPLVSLNRALVLEEQAAQYRKSGKNEQKVLLAAAALYAKLLELEPPFPQAFFNGGYFFLFQNDYQKAAACFSRYIEIAQDEDKRKRAEKALKKIRDNGLDDESFTQANNLIREGRAQEGLGSIHDFLERHPLVWNGWFTLGWALRLLGRWTDGEAAFRKTIELGGGNSDTRNELAICLMETGDNTGARRELETALSKDPENVKIISNLGVLALKTGEKEKAAAFFRTVLELDEDDPVARKFLNNS